MNLKLKRYRRKVQRIIKEPINRRTFESETFKIQYNKEQKKIECIPKNKNILKITIEIEKEL